MKSFSFLLASIESELMFRDKPCPLRDEDIVHFGIDALSNYVVIADEEFNIGEAWYCKDEGSGSIYRVSPEFGPPVQFVNSSMQAFNASLEAAARWSAQHDSSAVKSAPRLVDELAGSLLKIDPMAFESTEYQWPSLISHMRICASGGDEEMELWFKSA